MLPPRPQHYLAPLTLVPNIKQFWFDIQTGMLTVEFMGTVEVELTLLDQNKKVIFTERYIGHHNEENMGGLDATWQRVMDMALADMIQQINLSPQFKKALAGSK